MSNSIKKARNKKLRENKLKSLQWKTADFKERSNEFAGNRLIGAN